MTEATQTPQQPRRRPSQQRWLRTDQLCQRLGGVHSKYLYALRDRGELVAIRPGRDLLWDLDSVEAWEQREIRKARR